MFEPTFSEYSYGYRPGRSARDAVEQLQREGNQRRPNCQVVDCDLKAFFDTVDHGKLTERLRKRVDDPRLLRLIGRYLKSQREFKESVKGLTGRTRGVSPGQVIQELTLYTRASDPGTDALHPGSSQLLHDRSELCRSPRP